LDKLKGKRLIIYFYPKDNTPGCKTEAIEFTKFKKDFAKLGYTILGISKDDYTSHCNFVKKNKLEVLLLSDISGETIKKYGCHKITEPMFT
jgi:peroxiredoxin Q/BCP